MPKDKNPKAYSLREIESYAQRLRRLLGVESDPNFNIVSLVENRLGQSLPHFELDVLPKEELGDAHAATEFNPPRILIREDIYEAAVRSEARSRFTLAHELGHLTLHWGHPRPRMAPELQNLVKSRAAARMENEANQFAGAFLMPISIALKFDTPHNLARRCGVSEIAATKRLSDLWLQGYPTSVRSLFGAAKSVK